MKKIDKIKKFYNKYIGINLYELIFLIIFVVFCFYDTGYTIYKPGGIVNVDTRISGDNLNETNGSFNMAYVSAMKGKTPIYLISKIMPNWELVKNSDMLPNNETIEDLNTQDKLDYQEAMSNAKYVAFNKANVKYSIDKENYIVYYLTEQNDSNLKIGDEIISYDDIEFKDMNSFKEYIKTKKINEKVMVVDMKVASSLGDGAVSALDFAQKIIVFANTAITTAIVSVMYPLMANKLNEGDNEGFVVYLSKSVSIIALLLIPISFGFILLNKEVISIFYERGNFTASDVGLTSLAFLGYSLVLPFTGVRDILNSSLFSMQKTKVTTMNGVIGVIVNIILSITLSKIYGVFGVAMASTISSIVTAVLLFISTRRLVGNFDVVPMIIKLLKILFAAIMMLFVLVALNNVLNLDNKIIIILVNGTAGILIYSILCKILKIEEFNEAIDMIKNKVSKKAA